MPRTAGTKGMPRAQREDQIIAAAAEQIAHLGYAGLSLGVVAEHVGVSKPLVYSYFGTKDGLYSECVTRIGNAIADAIEPVLAGPPELAMADATLAAIFGVLAQRPYEWNVLTDRTHPADGPAADAARAARRRIAEQAARGSAAVAISRGVTDPTDLSALTEVWMGMVGAMVSWWQRHPEESAEAMAARGRRLITVLG
ncbi:TetR/AcrR family transcriptional regulator [Nocardia salmonicida]|uniref:TetR/AcrR family transcriptional regulator n=1 Tax=Nocardia salmonicida TaxID=53431 RepID=UPI00341B53C9